MRKKIGLFYGSSTCYTQMAGEKIAQCLGLEQVDVLNVAETPLASCQLYHYLIFGIPTWDYGELQEDWEEIWPELDSLDLSGKEVALYGLGDQQGYPEWFLDAMGYLHAKLIQRGARLSGYWPTQGYEFEASQALTPAGDAFVGLALDDETQFELSDERIARWCTQLKTQWGLP
ncbi:MAG TPA: flavodoxin FldB [Cellvibrionaceae bacterium]|nr:flavodoxin FldB [Cellvibrionaceae bacterium]